MSLRLPPYPAYKYSGVEWLGQIPDHWEMRRTKTLFHERVQKGYPDEPMLAATQTQGVVPKLHYESRTVTAQKDLHLLKLVEVGDYVISLRSFQGGIEYAHYRGIISPAYTVLTPASQTAAQRDYFEFFFKSQTFVSSLTLFVTGIREGQNIDYERLSRSRLPVPPPDEQEAIGCFLRHTLAKTNRLIKAKRRLIELLHEQKQAVVHRAVTVGLDPDAPRKPSGVDWLGDIPAHWNVLRTKFIVREVDQRSMTGEETHLSMSQKLGLVPNSSIEERRLISESYVGAKVCQPDDIVLNRLKAHLGVFALANETGLVSPDYTVFRAINECCVRYFERLLRTPACRVELRNRAKGIVQGFWRLYTDDFYQIFLPVPPPDEQQQITTYLDTELSEMGQTVNKVQREIELIREYRTRLIADIVTGKIDARGVEFPVSEAVAEWENIGVEIEAGDADALDEEAATDADA